MSGSGTDRTKTPLVTPGFVVVLVQPQLPENIGMAARAMANFGLSELRIVSARAGWPNGARSAASGATHVLDQAQIHETVLEAIADLTQVFATTARARDQMKRVYTPETMMPDVRTSVERGERVGVLFGPERSGLTNEDISLCDAIVTFPVDPAFASLNLAQAVLLMGYEWFRQTHSNREAIPVSPSVRLAKREAVLSFFTYLENELDLCGFFTSEEKKPVMARNLRDIFHRLEMTEQDVRTLRGAVVALTRRKEREIF